MLDTLEAVVTEWQVISIAYGAVHSRLERHLVFHNDLRERKVLEGLTPLAYQVKRNIGGAGAMAHMYMDSVKHAYDMARENRHMGVESFTRRAMTLATVLRVTEYLPCEATGDRAAIEGKMRRYVANYVLMRDILRYEKGI